MKLELKYFDVAGRGEIIRILLHGCTVSNDDEKIVFTDVRISMPDWINVKSTLPLNQVPVLNIDGINMTQSTSLYRYCAKLVGLYPPPSNPFQELVVDEAMDIISDLIDRVPNDTDADTDELLKVKRHEFRDAKMKPSLDLLEKRIVQYSNGSNSICGIPSVADLLLLVYHNYIASNAISHLESEIFYAYPRVLDVVNAMKQHPIVVGYNSQGNKN